MDEPRESWSFRLERSVSSVGNGLFWATCSPTSDTALTNGLGFPGVSWFSRSSEAPGDRMMLWQLQRLCRQMNHRGGTWWQEAESCWRGDSTAHLERKLPVWCFLSSCPPQGTDVGLGLSGNGGRFTGWPAAPSPSGSPSKLTHILYSPKRVDTYVGTRTGSWLRYLLHIFRSGQQKTPRHSHLGVISTALPGDPSFKGKGRFPGCLVERERETDLGRTRKISKNVFIHVI